MKNKLLSINKLKKNYHTRKSEIEAIRDISLDIFDGDFISIVGPSGCGKSTILSILVGIESLSDGSIQFLDNLTIGYMFQGDSLFPWRTVLDNCLVGLEMKGKVSDEDKNYVISLLKIYGLNDFIYKFPSSLSGGMRQRVALIRTLALKPDILLLDEPLSALDYQTRLKISDDIYDIIKKEKKTVIMVTHDISEAVSMSNKVVVLSNRPARIKNVYEIDFSSEVIPSRKRSEKKFFEYFNKIWEDLDEKI